MSLQRMRDAWVFEVGNKGRGLAEDDDTGDGGGGVRAVAVLKSD